MTDQTINQERLRRMLKQAFGEVPCPEEFKKADACGPVSHEVALQLRRSFYEYEPEEIRYMLPSILEDMMNTRTGDDIETADAERLVLQLDPFRIDNQAVRKVSEEQFANFNQQQSQAICEWLRMARSWNELSRFTHWVDASIAYWCNRSAGRDEHNPCP